MSVWLVRAGRNGENEDFALENHCVVWGGDEVGDLTHLQSPADVESRYRTFYPNAKPKTIKTWAAQGWAFCSRIQEGDLAILPLKTRSAIAVGKVTGSYQWKPANPDGAKHTRPVKWIRTDIPRSDFHQDVLYRLGRSWRCAASNATVPRNASRPC